MKTKLFSIAIAGTMLFTSTLSASAVNDSTKVSPEQRVEQSAMNLAAESMDMAAQAMKDARKSSNNVREYVNSRLNDTIINGKAIKEERNNNDYVSDYINRQNNRYEHEQAMMDKALNILDKAGKGITIFVAVVIIIIALCIYFNRRQKYKIIQKAIENNYPLPPGFFGKNAHTATTTVQHIHYTPDQAQHGIPAGSRKVVKTFNASDWATFRSGIKYCAWGIAFTWFFLLVDAPIWVFFLIPIIIGVSKLFTAYKLQQADKQATFTSETDDTTPPPFIHDDTTKASK